MALGDTLLSIAIILSLIAIIYTRIKNQQLKDTLDEIKDLVTAPVQEEYVGI